MEDSKPVSKEKKRQIKKKITITIAPDLVLKAKKDAEEQGRSLSNYISHLIRTN